jgi:hypothetical protein
MLLTLLPINCRGLPDGLRKGNPGFFLIRTKVALVLGSTSMLMLSFFLQGCHDPTRKQISYAQDDLRRARYLEKRKRAECTLEASRRCAG